MKFLLIYFSLLICSITYLQSQSLLTNPNKLVNGKKQGLWSEFNFMNSIDTNGNFHIVFGQHYAPCSVIAEGLYINNQREGFWKTFWIFRNDSSNTYKGNIQSITEFKNGIRSNLYLEYYENENLKVIGHFETFPANEYLTIKIPDLSNQKKERLKDTTIHITLSSKPKGNWIYFLKNSEILQNNILKKENF